MMSDVNISLFILVFLLIFMGVRSYVKYCFLPIARRFFYTTLGSRSLLIIT